MGLIPEIDLIDDDIKHFRFRIRQKSEAEYYEEFAKNYCKKGHTWIEACELICNDMRRRDPVRFNEQYLSKLMDGAKEKEARLNAQNSPESK